MSKRYPPARYTLPNNLAPSTFKCFKISVPDDPFFIAAFRGQMLELGSALSWADDPDHKALQAAATWREVITNIVSCDTALIPVACPYDFRFGDTAGWQPIITPGHTYAFYTGAGWHAGYTGYDPGDPYYQLQIYHTIASSIVYSYTIEYACLMPVNIAVSPDFVNQGPFPPGAPATVVVAADGTATTTLRVIMTTNPPSAAGSDIVITRVTVNIANSTGSCS